MPQTEKKVHVTLGKEIFGKEYEEWIPFGEESHPMRHMEKKLISTFLLMQIMRGIELHGDLIQVSLSS